MSALLEEPKELPGSQVYRGGSAGGVQCAACGETSTSGSWRRGWSLIDKESNANLCNKCGQRWVKLTKALANDNLGRVAAIVDPKSRFQNGDNTTLLVPQSHQQSECTKRRRQEGNVKHQLTSVPITAPRPVRKRQSKRLTESEDTEVDVELTEDGDQRQDAFEDVGNAYNGHKAGRSFYCIQKLSDGGANFVLFWVLDPSNPNVSAGVYLAAYGIDPRGTGHFTYTHAPATIKTLALPSAVPVGHSSTRLFSLPTLKCTNRGEVLSWLASSCGADTALPEAEVRLPTHQMNAADLRALLNRLQHAEQQPGIGNHLDYLEYFDCPMRTASGLSVPATSGVGGGGLYRTGSTVLMGRGSLLSQQFSLGHLTSGVLVESVLGSPTSAATRSLKGAKVKPTASGTLVYLDVPYDEKEASEPSSMPRFRCGTCGRDDHRQDECPLGCISPPSLIHDPDGSAEGHLVDHLILMHDGSMTLPQSDNDSPIQETAFTDNCFTERMLSARKLAARAPSAGSPCRPGKPATVDWIHTLPPAGVEHTFRAWYATLTGVIGDEPSPPSPVTSPSSVGAVHGHSFSCSSGGYPESNSGVAGLSHKRWVPTGEALSVLHQLVHLDVDLALLERTQISRAVAALRRHHIPAISRAAEDVADRWRSSAEEALGQAEGG